MQRPPLGDAGGTEQAAPDAESGSWSRSAASCTSFSSFALAAFAGSSGGLAPETVETKGLESSVELGTAVEWSILILRKEDWGVHPGCFWKECGRH